MELETAFTKKKGREFDVIVKAGGRHREGGADTSAGCGPYPPGSGVRGLWDALRQARHQIQADAKRLEGLGIGGSAVRTGLNAHPRFPRLVVRRLVVHTGLKLKVADDLRAAMQSQLPAAAVAGSLRNLALELIRIANDLRLLASGPMTGLNEIALPALQPGSSIMPWQG